MPRETGLMRAREQVPGRPACPRQPVPRRCCVWLHVPGQKRASVSIPARLSHSVRSWRYRPKTSSPS